MYRMLLSDQGWEDLQPDAQAELRAEGSAFQVDMASELDAPFEFERHARTDARRLRDGHQAPESRTVKALTMVDHPPTDQSLW
jgi:hypothetical protein